MHNYLFFVCAPQKPEAYFHVAKTDAQGIHLKLTAASQSHNPQQHSQTNSNSFLLIACCATTNRNRDLVSLFRFGINHPDLGVYSMNRCIMREGKKRKSVIPAFCGHCIRS
jgi:hypothetical protein